MTSSLLRGNRILQMDVSEKLSEDWHCLPNINELGELLLEVVFRLHLFSTFVVLSQLIIWNVQFQTISTHSP